MATISRLTLCAALFPSCLFAGVALAQSAIPVVAPFTREFDPEVFLAGGQAFDIDLASLRAMPADGESLVVDFPIAPKQSIDLLVHRINPRAEGAIFVVVDAKGREIPVIQPETHFFGGEIVGVPGSRAFLSVTPAGCFGWIDSGVDAADAHYIVTSGPFTDAHAPAVFDTSSAAFSEITWTPFGCEALTVPADHAGNSDGGDGEASSLPSHSAFFANCRAVDIAIDTDQELLNRFGGDTAAALGYVQTLVAGADEMYRRDASVQIRLSYSRFWAGTDPWLQTSTSAQLPEFRNYWAANMAGIGRDVAQLLSARSLGGGIAWLNAICTDYGFGVCGNLSGNFPSPLVNNNGQNWDMMVFAHELGHNAGSAHTHDFCPPLDQCAPNGYFGQCQTAQVCTSSGTLMSYCHQCNGGMTNLVLAFHPTCATAMSNYLSSTSCAPTVICSSNPACVLTISSAAASYPFGGGSATIAVTTLAAGCGWTPVAVAPWITITNPGPTSGNGSFAYTVQANQTAAARSFTLLIGDLSHTITQANFYDCNSNSVNDAIEIAANPALDCNGDGILNSCAIISGAADCDANGVPDSCQVTTPVLAWGAGSPGSTGFQDRGQATVPSNLGSIKAIGAGGLHSLAVRSSGSVAAWGDNGYGQSTVPVGLLGVISIAGGGYHSMALTINGSVTCWGQNLNGQCAVPTTLGFVTAIAAGNTHSVALNASGNVFCWGANSLSQSTVPPGLTGVIGISAGLVNTMALRSIGTVVGWGQESYGQTTPPVGLTGVTKIVSGGAHSVALKSNSTMVCWGDNTYGQSTVPTDLGPVQQVFAGGFVTVALLADGSARAWGRNDHGEATLPANLGRATMFAGGNYHTMSLATMSQMADCDADGIADACEIASGAADTNHNGVPDSCEARATDVNGDGTVDASDLAILLGSWGATSGPSDINQSGLVDAADLATLLGDWG